MDRAIFLVVFLASLGAIGQVQGALRQDIRLFRLLKKRLSWAGEPVTRPVDKDNPGAATQVGVGFTLTDIQNLKARPSGRTADLETMGWLSLNWTNPGLRWSPSQFGGINQIRLPIDMLWTPDIKLFGSTRPGDDQDRSAMALVMSAGTVLWIPPTKLYSTCQKVSGTSDWQCKWKLGSWTYDGSKLSLLADQSKLDTTSYPVADWNIRNATAVKKSKTYACCTEQYEHILMSFKLSPNW